VILLLNLCCAALFNQLLIVVVEFLGRTALEDTQLFGAGLLRLRELLFKVLLLLLMLKGVPSPARSTAQAPFEHLAHSLVYLFNIIT
jgi:hypothetical protein